MDLRPIIDVISLKIASRRVLKLEVFVGSFVVDIDLALVRRIEEMGIRDVKVSHVGQSKGIETGESACRVGVQDWSCRRTAFW